MISIKEEVEKEVEKIRNSYIASVHRLNSDNGTAASFSKDYEGRQIYELLQNAEDQVKDNNGFVKIELYGNTLKVFNTGEPFNAKGFISILYVCDSPKEHITAKTIGYKGIGFRSILNWSDEITIISAGLKLEFSRHNADETFNSILKEVEDSETYEKDLKETETSKVPVLVCPKIRVAPQKIDIYDTVIEFTCFDSVIENVKEQIKELKPEVLLFLKKLRQIEFDINGEQKRFIREDSDDSTKKILTTDYYGQKEKEVREYDFFTEEGKILDKYYEISIGYDRKTKTSGEMLYSYFKTNVEISFPAFIHATFELSSNRNELLANNKYNEELTKKLASKLAETAISISLLDSQNNQATYEPLKLLLTSSIDTSLKQYKLEELIKEQIQTAAIFPSIQNRYISLSDEPLYSEQRFDKVLFPETFSNLLKYCDDEIIQNYIKYDAKLNFYENSLFKDLLNKDIVNKRYSCGQKCTLIKLINENHSISGTGITLLEDLQGNIISSEENVYVHPAAKDKFEIPNWNWLKVKFLNEKMRNILLEDVEQEAIDRTFRDFNLVRYRFNTLIGKIVSDLNKNKNTENVKAVLLWLFNFYCTPKSDTEETGERDLGTTKIPVLCRNNTIAFGSESYFGKEFGNEIGERIISSYDKEHFLYFGLFNSTDLQTVIRFYEWLGVTLFPRIKNISIQGEERKKYIDYCFENKQYLKSDYGLYEKKNFDYLYISSLHLAFFENFDKIIKNNDFQDLLLWFLIDENVVKSLDSVNELSIQSEMTYTGYRKQNLRTFKNETLSNYIRFYLTKNPWINFNGNFYSSEYCCLEELRGQSLIITPKIDIETIKKYRPASSLAEIQGLLLKLGVSEKFSDMKTDVKYELLLKLPEIDTPECKFGKSIYNKFKGTAEKIDKSSQNYKDFLENGKVLVFQNYEKKYISVKKAKYTPNKLFSEKILNEFPMLVYDYRQGRVQDIFGVELLGDIHPSVSNEKLNANINKQFNSNFEEFKVYILASRLITNESDTDLRKLNRLNIVLANSLTVDFPINNEKKSVKLDDYQTVYLNETDEKKRKLAYIKIPDNCTLYTDIESNPYFAYAVAEIVSTVLDLSNDLAFFSSLFSSSHERRKNLLINTKGEEVLDYIDLAQKKLNIVFNSKQEFWISIASIKNIHFLEESPVIDIIDSLGADRKWENKIDYNHINKIETIPILIDLFKSLKIDIEEYNKQTADKIYLTEYYKRQFDDLKINLKDKYFLYLYEKYKEKKLLEDFETDKHNYLPYKIEFKNSVNENVEEKFENAFSVKCSELRNLENKSLDEIINEKKNSSSLYSELQGKYTSEMLDLYLLFDCLDKLKLQEKEQGKLTTEKTKKSAEQILSEAKDLAKEPEYQGEVETEGIDDKKQKSTRTGHKFGSGNKTGNINDNKEIIGLAGEIAVYETLTQKYSTVEWLSENAVKYGLPHTGDDSLGYDLIYINDQNEKIMVEVKATTGDQIEFDFSNNEFSTALEDPDHYEVFFVFLHFNGKPKVLNLGTLFKFENENESPFNNSKFSIQYDKYIIKAKEKD